MRPITDPVNNTNSLCVCVYVIHGVGLKRSWLTNTPSAHSLRVRNRLKTEDIYINEDVPWHVLLLAHLSTPSHHLALRILSLTTFTNKTRPTWCLLTAYTRSMTITCVCRTFAFTRVCITLTSATNDWHRFGSVSKDFTTSVKQGSTDKTAFGGLKWCKQWEARPFTQSGVNRFRRNGNQDGGWVNRGCEDGFEELLEGGTGGTILGWLRTVLSYNLF